jgi:hypothetical protein
MKTEKMNNDEIPCSMQMPKTDGQSAASKHVRKEIDDWLNDGNEKTIIPTKENE